MIVFYEGERSEERKSIGQIPFAHLTKSKFPFDRTALVFYSELTNKKLWLKNCP